ncbi:hypothetical protein ACFVX3_28640 [Rhodococcus erythropolis]|uniref:Uncharacterized protein n=1 Tax=Rhodococcus erythropolis TaxID=1833 RepID=A0AAX3ZY30_RHOER|nr:hypothetical protein [Rhodococcus erythropolis]WMN01675.1 hypothetical protein QIE55_30635 [Rhodococcus erythropolis]
MSVVIYGQKVRLIPLAILVGLLLVSIVGALYNVYQNRSEPVVRGSNAAYQECVDSASRHLMEMVPGLKLKDAIAKAEVSPRCSAILNGK